MSSVKPSISVLQAKFEPNQNGSNTIHGYKGSNGRRGLDGVLSPTSPNKVNQLPKLAKGKPLQQTHNDILLTPPRLNGQWRNTNTPIHHSPLAQPSPETSTLRRSSPSKSQAMTKISLNANSDTGANVDAKANAKPEQKQKQKQEQEQTQLSMCMKIQKLQQERILLHEQYIVKQAKIKELEQELGLLKHQLLELEAKIESVNREEIILLNTQNHEISQYSLKSPTKLDVYKQAAKKTENDLLRLKLANDFDQNKVDGDIDNKVELKPPQPMFSPLKKQASFILEECANVTRKASTIFEKKSDDSPFLSLFVKQSNVKMDSLTRQTSQFFNEIFKDSREKTSKENEVIFDIEDLNKSITYDDEVDIDDYDSSFE
ncbi:hypothetical protein LELG_03462 [Lodderomyces elongisporus NRRL YB-4239]|uniref:Uncharacterized protein n=1 Tax=Lodderomyces elongisporus (strain ATCC 11503 / CBS 2605 / JCM 1781 / NBRC 1676 / NRRL YB-4239) TaxID=379508 RepID=A5E1H5_LODEL|nr:hypothetical protein LELG_03462 [Lodderomyces elongisporus NRRL YB-4239]